MSIMVVCPGCRKSFKVSDKFAGQTGPCPKCKHVLKVPTKSEEVKVHAPEQFEGGGRSTTGKLVIKPDEFVSAKFSPLATGMVVAAAVTVLAVAWLGGRADLFSGSMIVTSVALLVISPPLVLAGYWVLRDAELEPYSGRELYIRASLCAGAYAILWGLFVLLVAQGWITGELWSWLYVVPPFVLAGGLFAMATLDMNFGDCVFHYGFYLVATMFLRWLAGMNWVWNVD